MNTKTGVSIKTDRKHTDHEYRLPPDYMTREEHDEDVLCGYGDEVETVLMESQSLGFQSMGSNLNIAENPVYIELVEGSLYYVFFDNVKYECVCKINNTMNVPFIGNDLMYSGEDNGLPFMFITNSDNNQSAWLAYDSELTHIVSMSVIEKEVYKIPSDLIEWDDAPFKKTVIITKDVDSWNDDDRQRYYDVYKSGTLMLYRSNDLYNIVLSIYFNRIATVFHLAMIDSLGSLTVYTTNGKQISDLSLSGLNSLIRDYFDYECRGLKLYDHTDDGDTSLSYGSLINSRFKWNPTTNKPMITNSIKHVNSVETNDIDFVLNGDSEIILASSTADSTKRFKITVDDSGTISATEVTS